jgi:hypothetical protein
MEIKRLAVFISIFYLMFSSIVSAQEFNTPDWVRGISGAWIFVIVVAFIFIVYAMFRKSKWALSFGVLLLFASIILIMVGVLLPMFAQPTVTYEQCTGLFKPDASVLTLPGALYATSCIVTGYAAPGVEWLVIITFFMFGIITPLALMFALFWEFIPEQMITNVNARRVITFAAGMFAFRGFFASYFIDMLSYGFAGIGALLVGVLFTGIVYKAAYRFCRPLGVDISTELRYYTLAEAEQVRREIGQLDEAFNAASAADRPGIQERINRLTKRLHELEHGKG